MNVFFASTELGSKASLLVQNLEASTGEASGCGVGGKDWAWSRLVVSGVGLVDAGWCDGVQGVFCKDLGEGWSGKSTILGVFFLLLRLLLPPCCWSSSLVLHGASWEGLEGVFGVLGRVSYRILVSCEPPSNLLSRSILFLPPWDCNPPGLFP